jgi:hypothetical protein
MTKDAKRQANIKIGLPFGVASGSREKLCQFSRLHPFKPLL